MEARIEKAARGDRESMAAIVADHYPAVYRFCARRIGPDKAQDAAQETFLTLQGALRRFDGTSSLQTFLFGIALNHCRNMARKHAMEMSFEEIWSKESNDTGEPGLINRELLRTALLSLSREHREAVVMHEIEGLSYDEIAAILRVPSGTIKSRLHHAFLQLRTRLAPVQEVSA